MRNQFKQACALRDEVLLDEKRQDFQKYRFRMDDVHLSERE